ncbi:MAG: 3-phosphoglycerate dehydrogenase family protein [Firmicutes bacterium]|nr:3-phosphoglycerate dehydrogenase family protein [Bacillota bacterium]
MYKILALNKISDIIYEQMPKAAYAVSAEEAAPDAVLVRSASMHGMATPDSVLAVARAGAGVNNIPVSAYTKAGIAVFNTPGANANAVAELVVLGMLMSGRRVAEGIEWVKGLKGQEDVPALVEKGKGQFVGPELRGKTLGVIGLGAIGALVANAAANGLGMEVIGIDPYISVEHAWSLSRAIKRAASLAELLADSHFVSVHVPLGEKTRGMFNEKLIGQMKTGAHLLNFSRAELVQGDALRAALAEGKLASYVTDFPTEDMLDVPGVVCIPHLGASTPESEECCAVMAAAQLRDYLEKGTIHNSVNLPEISLGQSEGSRVLIIHDNAPGLVSQISGLISARNINIVNMLNKSRGDVAVTVLELGQLPEASLLEALGKLEQVARVRLIQS